MGTKRRRSLTLILYLLICICILAGRSNATYSVWGLRRMMISESAAATNNSNNSSPKDLPPLPSPVSSTKEPEASSTNGDKPAIEKPKDQVANDTGKANPKSSNKDDNKKPGSAGAPVENQPVDSGKNDVKKEKNDGEKTHSTSSSSKGSCEGSTEICRFHNKMTACVRSLDGGFKLLIQNDGGSILKVNVTLPKSPEIAMIEHVIAQKQTEKIDISSSVGLSSELLLKAGDDECVLHVGRFSPQANFLKQLPSYYKQITPIYIAYFFFLIALIVGGTCLCCQLKKWKRQDGVPYQELEMGISESASANKVESAEGWDDGWDDDWDDNKAVKSPGPRAAASISANGLTSRSANKDAWGKDWDD